MTAKVEKEERIFKDLKGICFCKIGDEVFYLRVKETEVFGLKIVRNRMNKAFNGKRALSKSLRIFMKEKDITMQKQELLAEFDLIV